MVQHLPEQICVGPQGQGHWIRHHLEDHCQGEGVQPHHKVLPGMPKGKILHHVQARGGNLKQQGRILQHMQAQNKTST